MTAPSEERWIDEAIELAATPYKRIYGRVSNASWYAIQVRVWDVVSRPYGPNSFAEEASGDAAMDTLDARHSHG